MRAFVAVAEAGSFTAASDRLRASKKLVSKYVGQLEQELGARLFHRTTRRLSLTTTGQQYYPDCIRILEDIERSESALRQQDAALRGTIRLTAPEAFGVIILQNLLCRFRSIHPEVAFDINYSDAYTNIAEEGYDFALRIGVLNDSSLVVRKLTTTRFWAVASQDYLANAPALNDPTDLARHACIVDSNFKSGPVWTFTKGDAIFEHTAEGPFRVNSAEASRVLALSGNGIALLPDYIAQADVSCGRLQRVLSRYATPQADIHAVFLDRRYLPNRVRQLIDFLHSELR